MKELWNRITATQLYIFAGILFIWIGGGLCAVSAPGGLALSAFITAILLIFCGAAPNNPRRF
jgi:hypothetical protein